jgi:hypothetical protein
MYCMPSRNQHRLTNITKSGTALVAGTSKRVLIDHIGAS